MTPRTRKNDEIRRQRRRRAHGCWDHLIAAPLWPKYGVNLGTLLRTCDAVGACMAVPRYPWVPAALDKGNRLSPRSSCIHWVNDPLAWLKVQQGTSSVVGVELADDAIRLADLKPASERTIMVLGNEGSGIPPEALEYLGSCVEIPMLGQGVSLNVAVAGSLVLYRLAGMS
jgi:tRNA (guanosine-2'-O-)-methyltransferase